MRRIYSVLVIASLLAACNQPAAKEDGKGSTTTPSSETGNDQDFPYQAVTRSDWEKGDRSNIPVAMNVLKCYEVKDFGRMKEYLADSVDFLSAHVGNFRGSRDQFVNFLKQLRDKRADVKIEMNNYETVRNKNTKENWVSLWYTEKVTDNAGHQDSALSMDEYKIVNGKVAIMDTKSRILGQKTVQ